ncbi:hypothetical protein [Altererythrobacter litoralis]|uniref:Uncharacterized protein n=1 Tax=Altererythrobacter litoralis TaxID=3113904 RepID=A0ABU7GCH5_9SPHN|nr:hypothetical protein [Erythrobacteraceae bacterium 1XM1-14]
MHGLANEPTLFVRNFAALLWEYPSEFERGDDLAYCDTGFCVD